MKNRTLSRFGVRENLLKASDLTLIQFRVDQLKELSFAPTLFHNDFIANWSNIIVDDRSRLRTIIDWEFAGSGPAVLHELACTRYVYIRDGLSSAEIDKRLRAILSGYGLSSRRYDDDFRYGVDSIILLHALSALKKYSFLLSHDRLTQEPYRAKFAERAIVCIREILESNRNYAMPGMLPALAS